MVEFEKRIVAEIRKFYEGDKPIEEAPLEEQFEKFAELLMLSEEAKTECPELFYWQGMCEEFGIGVPPELAADAAENYKKGAKAGNADAQYRLSQLYAKGANGVEKNLMVALGWARKASAQGHADAKAFLQEQKMIEKSKVSLDYTKAAEFFLMAAEQGNAKAQYLLAKCFCIGKGVPRSYEDSYTWFTRSGEQGYAAAQYEVGKLCELGHGTEKDYSAAFHWYEKAAEQEHPDAQTQLGNCYFRGKGVEKDQKKALFWFEKAAEHGNAKACYLAGNCYKDGMGTEKDALKAKDFYEKGMNLGDTFSKMAFQQMQHAEDSENA